ncbi:MAG: FG-GAP-like repeat-containing protein, partial [Bryobacteraceae bacterium]
MSWDRKPSWSDPRVPFAAILAVYVALGITVLGFNRSPGQVAITVAACCVLDMALHYLLRGRRLLFPLSALISGLSLAILVNYAHGPWLPLVPVVFTIGSKYLVTFAGRHVFNPTLFGVVICLRLGDGMFSAAPAYQWGGSAAMAAFVVTAALVLFVFRIGRNALIVSFLGFYFLELCVRAWITRWHVPPETLLLGTVTSASFYLFTFFMITDPATSPASPRAQVGMAAAIVAADLAMHLVESLSTLFYAGFLYFTGRYVWLHARSAAWPSPARLATLGALSAACWLGSHRT